MFEDNYDFYHLLTAPGVVHALSVDILNNREVNISWNPPMELNGIIQQYNVKVISLTTDMRLLRNWTLEPYEQLHIRLSNLGKPHNHKLLCILSA